MFAVTNSARTSLWHALPARWQRISQLSSTFSTRASAANKSQTPQTAARRPAEEESDVYDKLIAIGSAPVPSQLWARVAEPSAPVLEDEPPQLKKNRALDSVEPARRPLLASNAVRWRTLLVDHPDALRWLLRNCSLQTILDGQLAANQQVALYSARRKEGGTRQIYIGGREHWPDIRAALSKRGVSPELMHDCFPAKVPGNGGLWYDVTRLHVGRATELDEWIAWMRKSNAILQRKPPAEPTHFTRVYRGHWLRMLKDYPEAREWLRSQITGAGLLSGFLSERGVEGGERVLRLWEAPIYGQKILHIDRASLAPLRAKLIKLGVPSGWIHKRFKLITQPAKFVPDLVAKEFTEVEALLSYLREDEGTQTFAGDLERRSSARKEDAEENGASTEGEKKAEGEDDVVK